MKVIERGHIYELESKVVDGLSADPQRVQFVNQQADQEHGGCTTQEVIRALLDRTRHCANCMPHPVNERIIYHLRMALVLHEARALERRVEKGEIEPEYLPTVGGSHLELPKQIMPEGPVTSHLIPAPMDGAKTISHPTN